MSVAWYDMKHRGLLRDIWIILHPQYSLWFLAYVVIGAALAPKFNWSLLGWTVLAFALGMVVAAHCLDELNGRPLKTGFPSWLLLTVAIVSLMGTFVICCLLLGKLGPWGLWIWFFWFVSVLGVIGYNLELWKPVHSDIGFAVLWGAWPVFTSYWIQAGHISIASLFLASFGFFTAYAQRLLSTRSRLLKRRVTGITGKYCIRYKGKEEENDISMAFLAWPIDTTLKLLSAGIILFAVALLLIRW